jgi:predicted nucleotidyltransferase component of viral defense system
MIQFEIIRNFFPLPWRNDARFRKFMLMEYVQLMILDYLSTTHWIRKLTFIGGTSIRLAKGIDRFSEDLDFDCKDLDSKEFMEMTDGIIQFLNRQGLQATSREKESPKLRAFRRSIVFPGLLFELGLTGHREERFLIKVESQDQEVNYQRVNTHIKGCGFIFPMPMPTDEVLCAMKLAAMFDRHKGRDFYDAIFLLSQSSPDFKFLHQRCGISDKEELKLRFENLISTIDLKVKMRDFEHLLMNKENSSRILNVAEFFRAL